MLIGYGRNDVTMSVVSGDGTDTCTFSVDAGAIGGDSASSVPVLHCPTTSTDAVEIDGQPVWVDASRLDLAFKRIGYLEQQLRDIGPALAGLAGIEALGSVGAKLSGTDVVQAYMRARRKHIEESNKA